jgi:hypothetical protein
LLNFNGQLPLLSAQHLKRESSFLTKPTQRISSQKRDEHRRHGEIDKDAGDVVGGLHKGHGSDRRVYT